MGIKKWGRTGMYAWDQRMGNKRERNISEAVVRMESCVDVMRTCRSRMRQCQTRMMLSMSRHSNKFPKGRETQAMGKLCGGDQMRMTESRMVVCTSKDPGGGAGISEQKLVMYRSRGKVISPNLDSRLSCVKYSRKAAK